MTFKPKIKDEWKGSLKTILILVVLCVGVGIVAAAWDDTKITGSELTAAEWNNQVTDQKARVLNSLFDANSILKADVDNTPVKLSIAEQQMLGRITGGDITGLTAAQVRTLINVESGAAADQTKADIDALNINADKVDACNAGVHIGNVFKIPASSVHGDVFYVNSAGNVVRLAAGTDGHFLKTQGTGANPIWVNGSGVTDHGALIGLGDDDHPQYYNSARHTKAIHDALNIDADKVDGCHAGTQADNVYKVWDSAPQGTILQYSPTSGIDLLGAGNSGYQLTSTGASSSLTWAAASDLIFSDTHCPKCGLKFKDGDNLILHVIGHNEVGDILTIPIHKECTETPKKWVTVKRKVFEDQYILNEDTGKLKVQRVPKMQEKTVTKHKLKKGYMLNHKTGKAYNKWGKEYTLSNALETVEEKIEKQVYENKGFLI